MRSSKVIKFFRPPLVSHMIFSRSNFPVLVQSEPESAGTGHGDMGLPAAGADVGL